MNRLSISWIQYESIIFFVNVVWIHYESLIANSLWIHYLFAISLCMQDLFREFTTGTLSHSRFRFFFAKALLNSLFFVNSLWIHKNIRDSLYFHYYARIHYSFSIIREFAMNQLSFSRIHWSWVRFRRRLKQ